MHQLPEAISTGAVVTIRLTGEVDADAVGRARTHDAVAIPPGTADVVVDLGPCTFLDSAGISLIVDYSVLAAAAGSTFRIVGANPNTRALLLIAGLHAFLADPPGADEH